MENRRRRRNNSLFLVARHPDDIVVLKRPPWWTPVKFLVAASVMAGVIVMILIWNAALRVLVERKSREVVKAQARKLESELRTAERTRLAADLHDSLSQNLTVIGYQVSTAKNTLGGKDPATTECLDTAAKMIRSCRIVRELVANAVGHGKATSIGIAGEVRSGVLGISVRDDGCGFDVELRPGQKDGHFGLDGIAERVERMEGSFGISSAPGKGTCAEIKLPTGQKPSQ